MNQVLCREFHVVCRLLTRRETGQTTGIAPALSPFPCQCVGVLIATAILLLAECAAAQQPATKKSGSATSDQTAGLADLPDAAMKEKILNSSAWKQAYDEFQKWLASQAIFTPADIERIKASLSVQIQQMPASELQGFLDDWQAKLKVLNGRDSQDALLWLGEYLSVLADGVRRQSLIDFGLADFPKLTASQLESALTKVRARRLRLQQQTAAFDQNRQQMVQRAQQMNAELQSRQPSTAARFGTNRSPYQPPRFDPPRPPRRQMFVDGNGQIVFALPN